ncbi:LOW QUALITY PROTEIN: INO80-like protein [Pseudozyma hubeiensis]|nr:LOW QUALITY PROTEIN: INO80-like protein [Pseudozyma hubeiensis]
MFLHRSLASSGLPVTLAPLSAPTVVPCCRNGFPPSDAPPVEWLSALECGRKTSRMIASTAPSRVGLSSRLASIISSAPSLPPPC